MFSVISVCSEEQLYVTWAPLAQQPTPSILSMLQRNHKIAAGNPMLLWLECLAAIQGFSVMFLLGGGADRVMQSLCAI